MRLAILCSGQVGQYRHMLDEIFVNPECESVRKAASNVLGQDVVQWWNKLDDKQIFLNANAQFSIAYYQMATWVKVKPFLPKISLVAGYSLGEIISYYIAGALSIGETFRLVRQRALLMDVAAECGSSENGCMVLWCGRVSPTTLAARDRAIQKYGLDIAIKRRNGEEVLAGPSASISRFYADLKIINPNLIRLPVTIPAHSHYLANASALFHDVLKSSDIDSPNVPVLSSVDAMPVRSRDDAINALSRQLSMTIRWDRCMDSMAESGINKVIELGPGNDLAKMIKAEHPQIEAHSVEDFGDYKSLTQWTQ